VNIRVRLDSYVSFSTASGVALSDLFVNTLTELLNEFSYYADCAGLHFKVDLAKGGLELKYSGYQDKIGLLVNRSVEEMVKMRRDASTGMSSCSVELFSRMKEKLLRNYHNDHFFGQPYYQCVMHTVYYE
jgi:secreted Zn-dependent insulinase-like peptidase